MNPACNNQQVLADYPEELRGDVSMHLHKEVSISHLLLPLTLDISVQFYRPRKIAIIVSGLQQVLSLPLFETASQGCQKSISLKIKTTFCAPDEFLVHKGDVLHSIFYLSNGSMEVLQDGMVVAILGRFFFPGKQVPNRWKGFF